MSSLVRHVLRPGALALALLLALAAPAASFGGSDGAHDNMRPIERPTLTAGDVEKVIGALPDLLAVTERYRDDAAPAADAQAPGPTAAERETKAKAFEAALADVAARHQFADIATMQQLVETVMLTAGFIKSGKTVAEIDALVAEQRRRIAADATLSPEQRDALERRMTIQVSMAIPSAANVDTVRPYFDRIAAVAGKPKP